jgi:glyoxylase-like metal-dependent hydrolase (beta-lactamase superfamily II)
MAERHPANAPGEWYIDTSCIDCGASRTVAPGLIVEAGGQCVFARQPETEADRLLAWRARLLCPTASVHTEHKDEAPEAAFPEEMTRGIYRLGYNARASWGAHSFFVPRRAGNLMIDAPRWTRAVVTPIEAAGGLADILLTHRDDIGDAERYAKHFGAHVSIHQADRRAAPFADTIFAGREPVALAPDLSMIPLPGHTEGSVAYLYDRRFLFTGDSLSWNFDTADLRASRDVCWWSWPEQVASLARLASYPFEWIFAGHGGSVHLPAAQMHARLKALVERSS